MEVGGWADSCRTQAVLATGGEAAEKLEAGRTEAVPRIPTNEPAPRVLQGRELLHRTAGSKTATHEPAAKEPWQSAWPRCYQGRHGSGLVTVLWASRYGLVPAAGWCRCASLRCSIWGYGVVGR